MGPQPQQVACWLYKPLEVSLSQELLWLWGWEYLPLTFFPVPGFTLSQPLLHRGKCSSEPTAAWLGLLVSQGLCTLPSEEQVELLCGVPVQLELRERVSRNGPVPLRCCQVVVDAPIRDLYWCLLFPEPRLCLAMSVQPTGFPTAESLLTRPLFILR